MNRRRLAALLSSLIAQLLLLLLSNPLSIPNSDFLSPLLLHFLSTSEFAATLSVSRKRKRTHLSESDAPVCDDQTRFKLGRSDSLPRHNPDSFKKFFNINSTTFDWLCGLLEPLLECRDPVDSPLNLSAETRLGIGLFRLATGADYSHISRQFSVSESVAKFCVKQLCRVLCTNYRFWVGFPNSRELESISAQFEAISGLPNCCGVLCCVRFKIVNKDNPQVPESIAAQLVVDSSSKILSVIAGFHGDKNDSQVLKSSTLFQDVEKGAILNSQVQFFVGDGDYPLLPWLMLPFNDPVPQSNEEHFNNALSLTRSPAVKAIVSLRNWGVLNEPIEGEVRAAVASIGACSILHNMLLSREDYSAFAEDLRDYSLNNLKPGVADQTSGDSVVCALRSALAAKATEFQSQKQ